MNTVLKEHVTILAGGLGLLSVLFVFVAAGGVIPSEWLPSASAEVLAGIPHVNALISVAAIGSIVIGWWMIRSNDIHRHRIAMSGAFGMFLSFLTLYLYRLIVRGGPSTFDGHETIALFVYYPLLAGHIVLAVICIPLLYYVILIGMTHPVAEIRKTRHRTVGRIVAPLWILTFVTGLGVYVLLYHM